ncbi:unnamed protein product [Gordionus sp. m RMFG-2023]
MAMNGINIALAFTGIEAIWIKVFLELGLTKDEILDYFSGPAYLAWNRMGNLKYLGQQNEDRNILWEWFTKNQYNLQKFILARMRSLDIIAVLPGFSGHLPLKPFLRLYPKAPITNTSIWGHLNGSFCCVGFLDPSSELYHKINYIYIQTLKKNYGNYHHIYNIDPFNELKRTFKNKEEVANFSRSIYNSLAKIDEQAYWLLQSWTFYDIKTWSPEYIKAFLTAVHKGKMIILDLAGDMMPLYSLTDSFYGQPFIWCVLHNFGGTSGMQGNLFSIQRGYNLVTSSSPHRNKNLLGNSSNSCVGIGLTMEGINQNNVVYEFVNDLNWRSEIVLDEWIKDYSYRRYGVRSDDLRQSWKILLHTVYSHQNGGNNKVIDRNIHRKHSFPGHGDYLITSMPSMNLAFDQRTYDYSDLEMVCNTFLRIMIDQPSMMLIDTFRYDLADIIRQCFQNSFNDLYHNLLRTYSNGYSSNLRVIKEQMAHLFKSLDYVLSFHNDLRLITWIKTAENFTSKTNNLFRKNALMQITNWDVNQNKWLMDYASKQWSGMFNCYYGRRWDLFILELINALDNDTIFIQSDFDMKIWNQLQLPFVANSSSLNQCLGRKYS